MQMQECESGEEKQGEEVKEEKNEDADGRLRSLFCEEERRDKRSS